jgi:hypothetical protein
VELNAGFNKAHLAPVQRVAVKRDRARANVSLKVGA